MVPWCFGVSRVYSTMEINMGAGDKSTGGVVPITSDVLDSPQGCDSREHAGCQVCSLQVV